MNGFHIFIFIIFLIKLLYIILSISHLYCNVKKINKKNNKEYLSNSTCIKIQYWRERVEFVFVVLMSILIIYLFYPKQNRLNLITYETKLLLFIFGIILLTKAPWKIFIEESPWFIDLQKVL
jgi:hypothetical protein